MRAVIQQQDQTIKQDITKLIEKTSSQEKEKQRLVEELKKLREDIARQADQKYEIDWEKLSRTAHWTNSSINMSTINNARRQILGDTSGVKLKTTFNTDAYFGPGT